MYYSSADMFISLNALMDFPERFKHAKLIKLSRSGASSRERRLQCARAMFENADRQPAHSYNGQIENFQLVDEITCNGISRHLYDDKIYCAT